MSTDAPQRDPYWRRRQAAAASREDTRRRLLVAADELFRLHGYGPTAVATIAERAGVSLQTLYLAWGSKRLLLAAATNAAALADQLPLEPDQWRAKIETLLTKGAGEAATAPAYLGAVSRLFVTIARRTGPYWQMHQQGAALDPDIAADWEALRVRRRETMAHVARGIPSTGLRTDLRPAMITDTLWSLASPELWELLTASGGYSAPRFQKWLQNTLTATLCATD